MYDRFGSIRTDEIVMQATVHGSSTPCTGTYWYRYGAQLTLRHSIHVYCITVYHDTIVNVPLLREGMRSSNCSCLGH